MTSSSGGVVMTSGLASGLRASRASSIPAKEATCNIAFEISTLLN